MALRLISRLIACAVFSGCAFSSALAQVPISALEQSLLAKKYGEFQKNAKLAAERGDADALFLLGKSYDLGWGVEKNRELARSHYKKAEGLGSVRAVHNLGVIALDAGQREEAIRQFQKALEKGLAMPTLWNLGRAYDPSESGNDWPLAKKIEAVEKSGDYYGQAFERSQDVEHAESAAAQFLRVYDWTRVGQTKGMLKEKDLPALRERTVTWLNKAMKLGSARAWSNWGGLLYVEEDYVQARKAFEQAAKGDVPQAYQYLGKLEERENPDAPQAAIAHYERALALEHPGARDALYRVLLGSLQHEQDTEVLGRGIKRLKELHREEDDSGDLEGLVDEYNWRKFLAQEKALGRTLPKLPVYLKACNLNEKFKPDGTKVFFPGSYWSMGGVGVDFVEYITIDGRVDAGGCASLAQPLPDKVREMLERGGMIFLRFPPAGRFMLDWQVKGNEVHLVPRPTGALKIQL
ncbi:tetratricopeptide repeat protein [Massilia eburnea]|uniref:tetratricopeptide repeat protein n=1 Tax=Massilia eburnea TaxID=1776165 RepID=UPI003D6A86C2